MLDPDQFFRILGLSLVAMVMSCLASLLIFLLGETGWYIAFFVIVLTLSLGCSQGFLEVTKQCCERESREGVAEDPPPRQEPPQQQQVFRGASGTAASPEEQPLLQSTEE